MANQNLNIQKYLSYKVQKGDSLSKVSKKFYGDFKQSGIIAQINNISDASKIKLGMNLKIPELKDHPFINQDKTASLEKLVDIPVQDEIEIDSTTLYQNMGMEFFNEGQFQNAILEFKKVLNSDPLDKASTSYISKSYYKMGLKEHTDKKYITAIEHFENALSFANDCSLCKKKIQTCRNTYLELHYKTGMKFFNEQNLNMAIAEWDLVQKVDQNYKRITELLDKAKTIQTNIDVLKKSKN
jgi:tetratricopeptide (TPR) repeat protein